MSLPITICLSYNGMHRMTWYSAGDGGGYWACDYPGCSYVEPESTGHHGG